MLFLFRESSQFCLISKETSELHGSPAYVGMFSIWVNDPIVFQQCMKDLCWMFDCPKPLMNRFAPIRCLVPQALPCFSPNADFSGSSQT